jgi:hypothetical protein
VFSLLFLAFLFAENGNWLEVIFDDRVIRPFLLLLIPAALFAVVTRQNPIWALIACCVPAGVAVGAINLLTPLIWITEAEQAVASPVVYGSIALGLILAYALRVIAPPYESNLTATGPRGFSLSLPLTVICLAAYILSNDGWDTFLNQRGLLFTIAVVLCCFAFNDKAQLTFCEVMARGGLFCCLLAAIYAVTLYTAGAAIPDPKVSGPSIAEACNLLIYGASVVIAAGACGARPPTDRELLTRDWHLTEAYVFITLIIFPPQTLLELFSAPGVVG